MEKVFVLSLSYGTRAKRISDADDFNGQKFETKQPGLTIPLV